MTDFAQALSQVLFDRLSTTVTLAPVYQHVPENTPPPVVIIGDLNASAEGAKGGGLDRFDFDIITVVQGPGRKPLNALQAEVRAALDQWQPADANRVSISTLVFTSSDGRLLEDANEIYYGRQSFFALVQSLF